jgi:deoxyribodipyrimidine photo-lyase
MMFDPTRAAGLQRLASFAPHAGRTYANGRNYDRGTAPQAVSGLSPYLRHRLISEVEVLRAVLAHHSPPDALSFVQEVFWRGYFKGWLQQHPSVWTQYQAGLLSAYQDLPVDYIAAVSGQTGIACFDHWSAQLRDTGYLHNHARMWFASIWIFTLRLPWELGADFFLRNLVDADPASNTLSWRWVGGLHTRGKHYLATAENIARFTNGYFDPKGQLNENAAPLVDQADHGLVPLPKAPDHAPDRALWLITEEDCLAPPKGVTPAGVLGIISPEASEFAQNAVRATALAAGGQTYLGHDWSNAIRRAARQIGTQQVACSYLPAGPMAEGFATTQRRLAASDIAVTQVIRPYDAMVWPHATKGFFKLKKQIPGFLERLTA